MSVEIGSRPFEIGKALRPKVAAAIEQGLDRLRPYVDELAVDEVVQPFFARSRILDCASTTEFPVVRGHLALAPDGEVRALSGQLANLNWLARVDPPRHLGDGSRGGRPPPCPDGWAVEA